ncbi:NAD-dependent epimerase/dehydratase family protein [Candidatus Lokiarchaeum ossiferum]|uniref:NAD-dependent epimerase/dehydratase family protein n=1 Tax=Candidatus Lokiarchaeum ossiferum TaxID=2951803 RepID=UPI00352F5EA0
MIQKTILITGGLGFIGSHIAVRAMKQGYHVCVADNLSRPTSLQNNNIEKIKFFTKNLFEDKYPSIRIYIEDICKKETLQQIFEEIQPSIIIHAAGQTSAIDSISNPEFDFQNNVIGLFNTLECCRQSLNRTTFIYFSTNKVYGTAPNNVSLTEGDLRYFPSNPKTMGIAENSSIDQTKHTPYGISKLTGDLYVQEYGKLYNMDTCVFRLSCIYGDRQFGFEEQGWVSHFVIQALLDKEITIYGNGKQVRDILYIDDLVDLVMTYFQKMENSESQEFLDQDANKVFNVGGGKENTISLLELIDIIEDQLGKKIKLSSQIWRPADQKYYVTDISKVSKAFSWQPQIDALKGLKNLIVWTQNHIELFS